jgi:hypothetical protein
VTGSAASSWCRIYESPFRPKIMCRILFGIYGKKFILARSQELQS